MDANRATARHTSGYRHAITIREHAIAADEPRKQGGEDTAPSPQELLAASLASCSAITMEMYAKRKGWDVSGIEVEACYQAAERGFPTRFELVMRFPAGLSDEQVDKLKVIAAKCPVHRVLDGEVMFSERAEHAGAPAHA